MELLTVERVLPDRQVAAAEGLVAGLPLTEVEQRAVLELLVVVAEGLGAVALLSATSGGSSTSTDSRRSASVGLPGFSFTLTS